MDKRIKCLKYLSHSSSSIDTVRTNLEITVNEWIATGYIPYGTSTVIYAQGKFFMTQTMIRYED